MRLCNFCKREFRSRNAVVAHLRFCPQYRAVHRQRALTPRVLANAPPRSGSSQGASRIHHHTPYPPHTPANPFSHLLDQLNKALQPPENAPSGKEARAKEHRARLQAAKAQAVDEYRPNAGTVTARIRGEAKAALERELAGLPLEELPPQEVLELAQAVRDRLYEPYLRQQQEEAVRQQEHAEKRRARAIRIMQEERQWADRKAELIEEAVHRARSECRARQLSSRDQLSVELDLRARLDRELNGGEPLPEAYALIEKVMKFRLEESDAKRAADQAKEAREWRELLMTLAVLLLAAIGLPWLIRKLKEWLTSKFGVEFPPEPEPPQGQQSGKADQSSTPQSPSRPIRRRRGVGPSRLPNEPLRSGSDQEHELRERADDRRFPKWETPLG